jgi:hypothetical protein
METKHTPGPWRWIGPDDTNAESIHNRELLTDDPNWDDSILYHGADWPISEGDLRLIAAAPALLEALKECITGDGAYCYRLKDPDEMVKALRRRLDSISCIARAALAKAKGE